LRGGEAATADLLLASRVLPYFTLRCRVPRPWAFSRRRGHTTPPRGCLEVAARRGPCPERGERRGAGAAAEDSKCAKGRHVWACMRPVRLPSSVRAPYRRPWCGGHIKPGRLTHAGRRRSGQRALHGHRPHFRQGPDCHISPLYDRGASLQGVALGASDPCPACA